jgi:phosphoglycolate phosphatase-like HAD superfamily hydrolase
VPATFEANRSHRLSAATTLILFDIDGTLVLTGGAGGRAMARAFEELFGIADAFASVQMPGRTDSWLLAAALDTHGIPRTDRRVGMFRDVYVRYLANELQQPPPTGSAKGVLPGIRELLDALVARRSEYVGLLTGNFKITARMKLEYFDLWRYFGGGAFGDESPDRNSLLATAIASVAESGGPAATPATTVVIGDTPLDVEVARQGGARSIAVATGSHGVPELRATGADVVFGDLSDTGAVVQALVGKERSEDVRI